MYWKYVCADGSDADAGDDCAALPLSFGQGHPVVPLASITLRPRHGIRAFLEAR